VKFLRPADMYPYDYGRFQYSELHYVTEGITSYYGDFMLLKAGIYDVPRFLQNLNIELSDHHLMAGRNYISLAEASFNSWVNGYGAETGIPSRKISFYTKGYIVAFLLDYTIRKNSQNKFSLDNVMREMYQKIGKAGRGYTKADFKSICEKFAGVELGAFFADYYDGVTPIDGTLREAIKYYGLGLKQISASNMSESVWGLRLHQNIVEAVIENSPAAEAGITKGAEIVAVAGHRASAEGVWQFVGVKKDIEIHYFYLEKLKKITLKLPARIYLPIPCVLEFATFPIENWEENRAAWLEPLSK
jgi:predicted metalloprotease with PDZ domain